MKEYYFSIDGSITKSGCWSDLECFVESATKAGHKVILINKHEPQARYYFYMWNGVVIDTTCKPFDW